MERLSVLLLLLELYLVINAVSGHPIDVNDVGCHRPLWTVVGRHYSPKPTCSANLNIPDKLKKLDLLDKYYDLLSAGQRELSKAAETKILEDVATLLSLNWDDRADVDITCTACKTVVRMAQTAFNDGSTPAEIMELGIRMCSDFNVMPPEYCDGIVKAYGPILAAVINSTQLEPLGICSFFLTTRCGDVDIPEHEWDVQLPPNSKPPFVPPQAPPDDAPKLKVLHLSDTHFDTQYTEGSWAECGLPLCCRPQNTLPDENATRAGKWGGWKCDTTERTLDNLLQHIASEHPDIDYIIWTGDLPAHDLWGQTRESNLEVLKKTVGKMSQAFPNTPVYPALGNHESVPGNIYPPPNIEEESMAWLYDVVEEEWRRWLPGNVSETVLLGAFYTTLARPGLRMVSMNMNYCYNSNWWLILNSTDPVGELAWLIDVLQAAESNNEKVHIIGHVPAGHDDCLKVWQENYYRILTRYEATVTAQFFGHTHNDELEVFYDIDNSSRPIAVGYLAPSVTTYTYLNPGYRIYYVDGDYVGSTRFVLDHETWILDLEAANRDDNPVWSKMYSAKEAYNLTSLMPEDWDKFYQRLLEDEQLVQLYHKHYWKDSPKRPECDENCKKDRLCDIRSCVQFGEPGSGFGVVDGVD